MSDASGQPERSPRRTDDVLDAEFETLPQRASPASSPVAEPLRETAGMEMLRAVPPARGQRGGPLFWTFGLTLVLGAFWISGGHALVGTQAGQAPVERPLAQSLRIVNVASKVVPADREMVLMVDGEVRNGGAERLAVPPLSISVTGKDGRVTRYFLGTSGNTVDPGASFVFSGRLAAPKDGVGTVTVDFRREGEN